MHALDLLWNEPTRLGIEMATTKAKKIKIKQTITNGLEMEKLQKFGFVFFIF